MAGIQVQFLSLALIPLVGFMVIKRWQRRKLRAAQRAARLKTIHHDGQPLDLAPLQERIAAVKADYIANRQFRPVKASLRRSLLSQAREKLGRLGFFRHQVASTESEPRLH
jgi:hypothetical protein